MPPKIGHQPKQQRQQQQQLLTSQEADFLSFLHDSSNSIVSLLFYLQNRVWICFDPILVEFSVKEKEV